MKRGLKWYKREPASIRASKMAANDGAGMTVVQAAIYDLVLDLIYENNGAIPNKPDHFASHFSNLGTRGARQAVEQLLAMPNKLYEIDGMLRNKRADEVLSSSDYLSEIRAKTGRKGGEVSGNSRRKARDNKDLTEATASEKREAELELEVEEERDIPPPPIETRARDVAAVAERLLSAARIEPEKHLPAKWCEPWLSTAVQRWRALGLADDEIVAVVRAGTNGHDPPSTPTYFDKPMQRFAATKAAPALTPIDGGRSEQRDRTRSEEKAERRVSAMFAAAQRLDGDGG